MRYEVVRCLGKQHLSAVSSAHNGCGVIHVRSNIAFGPHRRLAGVQAHTYTHCHPFRPGMSEEGPLGSHRCRNSIGGARKGHEEAFFIGLDLVTMKLEELSA